MSILQDVPRYGNAIEVTPGPKPMGRFNALWLGWLVQLVRAVQDLQSEVPLSSPGIAGPLTGPGPITTTFNVVARRPAIMTVTGTFIQSFVTAVPSWKMTLFVDNQFYTPGQIGDWQPLVTVSHQFIVDAGTHIVSCQWLAGNANGILQNLLVSATLAYT